MTHLVILDNRSQVDWVIQNLSMDKATKLVAITADALDALIAMGLPHTPVSELAGTHPLAIADEQLNIDCYRLAQEIDAHIGEQMPSMAFSGPGILSGQAYFIQYTISAVAKRAWLMHEAIKACNPDRITVPMEPIDPWFSGLSYRQNPWLDLLEDWGQQNGYHINIIPSLSSPSHARNNRLRWLSEFYTSMRQNLYGIIRKLEWNKPLDKSMRSLLTGKGELNVLFANSTLYDWKPVIDILARNGQARCYQTKRHPLNASQWWSSIYGDSIRNVGDNTTASLGVEFSINHTEAEQLISIFRDWLSERSDQLEINFMGVNLFPVLVPQLEAMIYKGPSLIRHADTVAERALEMSRPDVACFFSMTYLADKRFAFQCHKKGIPVVCYQHGFGYGVQIMPKDEQIETAHADYFLTYGAGIKPRDKPAFPQRARFVPVGSARIEKMIAADRSRNQSRGNRRRLNVLWLAESSTRNTLVNSITEDTLRYRLDVEALTRLGSMRDIQVVYRPYGHVMGWDGVTRWLERASLAGIRMDSRRPTNRLIEQCDVAFVLTSSPTVWAEVIGLGKPMVLYCDPLQTPLVPEFEVALDETCQWCRSDEQLLESIERFKKHGEGYIAELSRKKTTPFIDRYVLHKGNSAVRSASFLYDVCKNGKSVEEWENSWESTEIDASDVMQPV